ncbi:hypothetical protein SBA1_90065 [Candidatus Sulfotelmatobacter kueseliae]|uniref:Uncharacterized protein n=1 Tax=Candidatus Sulfotelmatobacter kueseliae TaxID=2042962 RepID=A0A2U3LB28_9BACT|nr:hypothetical protein SBA1_90065 [Candidatus Sulfotelmatobacter kueseliae]
MDGCENRPARTCVLCAHRFIAGTGAGIHPCACQLARGVEGRADLDLHLFGYGGSGRTFLPRLDAEFSGAAGGTALGARDRVGGVRAGALQQTESSRCAFQLAVRSSGFDCGNLLWPRLARAAPRAGFRHHPHLRGLAVVVVVLEAGVRGQGDKTLNREEGANDTKPMNFALGGYLFREFAGHYAGSCRWSPLTRSDSRALVDFAKRALPRAM